MRSSTPTVFGTFHRVFRLPRLSACLSDGRVLVGPGGIEFRDAGAVPYAGRRG